MTIPGDGSVKPVRIIPLEPRSRGFGSIWRLRSGSPAEHRHGEQDKDTDDAVQHEENPS